MKVYSDDLITKIINDKNIGEITELIDMLVFQITYKYHVNDIEALEIINLLIKKHKGVV